VGAEAAALEFPCDFPIKVMGRRQEGFAQDVARIVNAHAPDYDGESMQMRASRQGRYLCLTCTIHARSREQLDALYRALCAHPGVAMVL